MSPPLLSRVAHRFQVLGDPLRLALLNQLNVHGERCVQELAEATGQSHANVSKHLGVLTREGLLRRRKEGLYVFYAIDDPTLAALCMLVCGQVGAQPARSPSEAKPPEVVIQ